MPGWARRSGGSRRRRVSAAPARSGVWCGQPLGNALGRGASITGMSSPDPSSPAPRSRWRFVITPRWLAWHAFTVAAVWGMLWLGDWQFHRAESGNALSWAYTFEWPIFAAFGIVFWAKTIIDEGKPKQAAPADGEEAESAAEAATAGLPARRHV